MIGFCDCCLGTNMQVRRFVLTKDIEDNGHILMTKGPKRVCWKCEQTFSNILTTPKVMVENWLNRNKPPEASR